MAAEQNPVTDPKASKPDMIRFWRFVIGKFFGSFSELPKIFISLAILVLIFKTRAQDVPVVIKPLAEIFAARFAELLGWITAVIVIIASCILVSSLRKFYKGEIDKLVKVRDLLQEKLNKSPVQHSEP